MANQQFALASVGAKVLELAIPCLVSVVLIWRINHAGNKGKIAEVCQNDSCKRGIGLKLVETDPVVHSGSQMLIFTIPIQYFYSPTTAM